jgi:hypothetical protein
MILSENKIKSLIHQQVKTFLIEQYNREAHREAMNCPVVGYDKVQTFFGNNNLYSYKQGIELYASVNNLDIETFEHRDNVALPDRPQYGYDEIESIRKVPRSSIVIGGPDGTKVGLCLRLPGDIIPADPDFARADSVFILKPRFNAETKEKLMDY